MKKMESGVKHGEIVLTNYEIEVKNNNHGGVRMAIGICPVHNTKVCRFLKKVT